MASNAGPGSTPSTNRDTRFSTTMKWIGAATAVLTLLFALQRLVTSITDAQQKRAHATELLRVAKLQARDGHHDEAWATLEEGAALNARQDEIRAAQEDLAMDWLRNAHITVGHQKFADIVQKTRPVLVRGLTTADTKRRADLMAHLGWADFLLWKESGGELHPEEQYRRAVEIDSLNPFAHAMWGHWILYRHGSLDAARAHFASAARSGAHRDEVRHLQTVAISDLHDSAGEIEMLRLANELRRTGEAIPTETRRRMAYAVCLDPASRLRSADLSWTPIKPSASAEDELLAMRWMFDALSLDDGQDVVRDFCFAALEEGAGNKEQALAMFKSIRTRLPRYSLLQPSTDAALRRLSGKRTRS